VKRLLVVVAVLAAFLTIADRIGVRVASSRLAAQIRSSQHLSADPDVSIRGFPFLTQVIGGEYDDIEVTGTGLVRGGIHAASVTASLRGVHISLSDALSGSADAVPVTTAQISAAVGWDALENASGEPVRLSAAKHGGIRVATTVSGRELVFVSDPVIEHGELVLVPRDVAGRTLHLGAPTLPFGLHLTTARATRTGVVIGASGRQVTLRP
jgi:hypothetical protein